VRLGERLERRLDDRRIGRLQGALEHLDVRAAAEAREADERRAAQLAGRRAVDLREHLARAGGIRGGRERLHGVQAALRRAAARDLEEAPRDRGRGLLGERGGDRRGPQDRRVLGALAGIDALDEQRGDLGAEGHEAALLLLETRAVVRLRLDLDRAQDRVDVRAQLAEAVVAQLAQADEELLQRLALGILPGGGRRDRSSEQQRREDRED
jgi:hypothetical protein